MMKGEGQTWFDFCYILSYFVVKDSFLDSEMLGIRDGKPILPMRLALQTMCWKSETGLKLAASTHPWSM